VFTYTRLGPVSSCKHRSPAREVHFELNRLVYILLYITTLQLLELLRGIALVPASPADQEAKAAASAALDAAADEAVKPLKEQHATAAAAASAAARSQALAAALGAQIRFAPGKPPLSAAAAAGVIAVACDEAAAAMAALSATGGLAAKRAAAEQLMGMGSITESTAAALAAVLGENEAAGEVLAQLSEAAEKLQVRMLL
jgi:hypothetical protein